MNFKRSYLILNICLGVGGVLCPFSLMILATVPGIIGLITAVAGILQTAVWYRCPHCKFQLNFKGPKPKHCPECGEKLNWE